MMLDYCAHYIALPAASSAIHSGGSLTRSERREAPSGPASTAIGDVVGTRGAELSPGHPRPTPGAKDCASSPAQTFCPHVLRSVGAGAALGCLLHAGAACPDTFQGVAPTQCFLRPYSGCRRPAAGCGRHTALGSQTGESRQCHRESGAVSCIFTKTRDNGKKDGITLK